MHPETHLEVLAAILGFLLKTSLGFCVSWLISKVIVPPNRKFTLWFAWLSIAGAYWLWLLATLVPHPSLSAFPHPPALLAAAPIHPPIGSFHIQPPWTTPLSTLVLGLEFAYILVIFCFLCAAIKRRLHLRWILRFAYKAPDEIDAVFRPIANSMGARNVQLLMLSGIYSPATVGWIRPIILLPPVCTERSTGELSDVLRHELQHIRRRDFVFSGIASLFRTLLFFHPAAWYARRRLSLESELACDLAVISDSPESRANYAESLLSFARLRVSAEPTPWNLDFAGASSQLNVRIRSILAETRILPRWMLALRAAFGVLLLAGFIAAAPSLVVAFSVQQPQPAASFEPASATQAPALHAATRRADVRVPSTHTRLASFIQTSDLQPAQPAPTSEPRPDSTEPANPAKSPKPQIGASDPVLLRRGDPSQKEGAKQPSGIILLSSDPSFDSAARHASVASSISAGAAEALSLASHDHKDVH